MSGGSKGKALASSVKDQLSSQLASARSPCRTTAQRSLRCSMKNAFSHSKIHSIYLIFGEKHAFLLREENKYFRYDVCEIIGHVAILPTSRAPTPQLLNHRALRALSPRAPATSSGRKAWHGRLRRERLIKGAGLDHRRVSLDARGAGL